MLSKAQGLRALDLTLVLALVASAGTLASMGVAKGWEQRTKIASEQRLAEYHHGHGEGTLLTQPRGGYDGEVTRLVEPGLASMVFADKDFAVELVREARGNGERMCLADLGLQTPEFHGQRWWVFSC